MSGAECVDESKRPKPDAEDRVEPKWTTTSAHAGPGPGSLLPLLGVVAILGIVIGAWILGRHAYEMRASSPPPPTPPLVEARKSIGILPFTSVGDDASNDALAHSIEQDILSNLTRVRGLRVIPQNLARIDRPAARDPRPMGRDLGAGALLEGSVRRVESAFGSRCISWIRAPAKVCGRKILIAT